MSGAGGRTRTDMSVTSPDFESGAYTNFATPAFRADNNKASSDRSATAVVSIRFLRKLAPVPFILRFHLRHELDEFGCLSDAVQVRITVEQGVAGKARCGSLS